MQLRHVFSGVFLAVLAVPALAGAVTTTVHTVETTQPITITATNPCTSEPVVIEGQTHGHFKITVTPDLKIHAVEMTFEGQGTGENLSLAALGTRYHFSHRNFQSTHFDPPHDVVTLDERMVVTRLGETVDDDDFYMRIQSHVTINANGVPTVAFTRPTFECR
jgi:hypothetical protein